MALSFYMGFIIPLAAPVIVIHNLIYVPIVYGVFPLTFVLGLFIMAMLMSVTQMLCGEVERGFTDFGSAFIMCLF